MLYEEDSYCYEIFEDKKAIKFMDKHCDDDDLIKRMHDKYLLLAINPYKEAESTFKSKKCPKCKKGLLKVKEVD